MLGTVNRRIGTLSVPNKQVMSKLSGFGVISEFLYVSVCCPKVSLETLITSYCVSFPGETQRTSFYLRERECRQIEERTQLGKPMNLSGLCTEVLPE